ncbi:MAG: D-xylose ABC transporter substrate-binding protein [Alphaproteobacteria bacterium]|nr:D-xylose ABC transporter substrate-binding protein [Alphaproteobacteria bacterium]TAD91202.1 MAG: D-xylose ABC transporter substrate-binding protein [Alphaproteobacteria bacterium]
MVETVKLGRRAALGVLAGAAMLVSVPATAQQRITVGVSWSNFQEERWKTDEAAIKSALERLGANYISADAQSNPQKQLADIEGLITRGAKALIVLAQDSQAIQPAIARAQAEGIPVLGYDRLIEVPGVFYLTFDNREVGRQQAAAVLAQKPQGNYVFIKGSSSDPNADFLHAGQLDVLRPHIQAGRIRVVGEQYTDRWLPENAQRNMEQILTANQNRVDAVVASNDGTAGGSIAALAAQGLVGVPVSGQDGDHAALNRIARGQQTVSVWKDARELGAKAAEIAVLMARGTRPDQVPGAQKWAEGARKVSMDAIFLKPVAITRDNLNLVIDAGWVTRDVVCRGAPANGPAVCR